MNISDRNEHGQNFNPEQINNSENIYFCVNCPGCWHFLALSLNDYL